MKKIFFNEDFNLENENWVINQPFETRKKLRTLSNNIECGVLDGAPWVQVRTEADINNFLNSDFDCYAKNIGTANINLENNKIKNDGEDTIIINIFLQKKKKYDSKTLKANFSKLVPIINQSSNKIEDLIEISFVKGVATIQYKTVPNLKPGRYRFFESDLLEFDEIKNYRFEIIGNNTFFVYRKLK